MTPPPGGRKVGGRLLRFPPPHHPAAGVQAALPAGPPHPATRGPPHPTTQQPVGRHARAAPLDVALVFGRTPSRSASRAGVWTVAHVLPRAPFPPSRPGPPTPPPGGHTTPPSSSRLDGALALRGARQRLCSEQRPRAALLAVALVFTPTPSRCAARRSADVRTDALALRCSPSGNDPGAGIGPLNVWPCNALKNWAISRM